MDKQLFQSYSPEERVRMLNDNAEKKEEMTHPVELTGDELNDVKDYFISTTVEMKKLEDRKKEFQEWFKNEMKPLKDRYAELQEQLRYKVIEVTEDVLYIADHDEGMMGMYNEEGDLISQRPLKKEERQIRLTNTKTEQNG